MANRNIWPEGDHFASLLNDVSKCEWVIYAKRPFGGPVQVLKYLARYTHRVAISNRRLVSLSNGEVTFRWKDYADGNAVKEMTLDVREFTRRFLLHILPSGFVRIRHYGLLANRCRSERLECCRKLLACSANQAESPERANEIESQNDAEPEPQLCPVCLIGRMLILKKFEPGESGLRASLVLGADTS
jgi:Putative transposase